MGCCGSQGLAQAQAAAPCDLAGSPGPAAEQTSAAEVGQEQPQASEVLLSFPSEGTLAEVPSKELGFQPEAREFPAQVQAPSCERGKHEVIIGIDLGTYNCCVSCLCQNAEDPEVLPDENGFKVVPSYVAFTEAGVLVGDAAKKQAIENPKNTLFSTKRLIGRRFRDQASQVFAKEVPFDVVDRDGQPAFAVECMGAPLVLSTQEVAALLLMKLKHMAELHLGTVVKEAVVTVPANFVEEQRAEIRSACFIAGLTPRRILSEPIAAGLQCTFAYMDAKVKGEHNVLVFDLGGGTLDVTLLTLEEGICEIKAVAGDMSCGGDDFDNTLMQYVIEEFQRKHQKDLSTSARTMQSLRIACEAAKRSLSTAVQTLIEVKFQDIEFSVLVDRLLFRRLCSDLFNRLKPPVEKVLSDSGIHKRNIHFIAYVGGAARIYGVQQFLQDYFPEAKVVSNVNIDHAIACGAAAQGGIMNNFNKKSQDALLLPVTPSTLWIQMYGGGLSKMVYRNTTIPTKKGYTFETVSETQPGVTIKVFEGEVSLAKDNNKIGSFNLDFDATVQAQQGKKAVDITFDVDIDNRIEVHAEVKNLGLRKVWRVDSTLSKAEVARSCERLARLEDSIKQGGKRAAVESKCRFFFVRVDRILAAHDDDALPNLQGFLRDRKDWLVERELTMDMVCDGGLADEFCAVSHRWETPTIPDEKGIQFREIKRFLLERPRLKYVWYDFWCLPQGSRTKEEQAEFDRMLPNINLLYLGATVLILLDLSYISRFWTQFEAWLGLQQVTPAGLTHASESDCRAVISCIHSAPDAMRTMLVGMWKDKTPEQTYDILSASDVTVTNMRDKNVQLPKVLKLNAFVLAHFRSR